MTTNGISAALATRVAMSILPTGSVPHTERVNSRAGAWIAPIRRPCASASRRISIGSWLAGSFVTMTSTPVYPHSAASAKVAASGRANSAAVDRTTEGPRMPPG